jgi:hypothetical protein
MDMDNGHGQWTWTMDMDNEHGPWTWTMDMDNGHGQKDTDMDIWTSRRGHGQRIMFLDMDMVWTWTIWYGLFKMPDLPAFILSGAGLRKY